MKVNPLYKKSNSKQMKKRQILNLESKYQITVIIKKKVKNLHQIVSTSNGKLVLNKMTKSQKTKVIMDYNFMNNNKIFRIQKSKKSTLIK